MRISWIKKPCKRRLQNVISRWRLVQACMLYEVLGLELCLLELTYCVDFLSVEYCEVLWMHLPHNSAYDLPFRWTFIQDDSNEEAERFRRSLSSLYVFSIPKFLEFLSEVNHEVLPIDERTSCHFISVPVVRYSFQRGWQNLLEHEFFAAPADSFVFFQLHNEVEWSFLLFCPGVPGALLLSNDALNSYHLSALHLA
jgi:hypothetical protein